MSARSTSSSPIPAARRAGISTGIAGVRRSSCNERCNPSTGLPKLSPLVRRGSDEGLHYNDASAGNSGSAIIGALRKHCHNYR
jgi:hypothetical protein